MSYQSIVMSLSVLAIAFAAGSADEFAAAPRSSRAPSSVPVGKELGFVKVDSLKHTHKLVGPLSASVALIGAGPVAAGDVFVLQASVSASDVLSSGVSLAWELPAGVAVVGGRESFSVPSMADGEVLTSEITLRQVSAVNERVVLRVKSSDPASRFSDVASYMSLEQEHLNSARKALAESTDALLSEQKLKVMH